jgi:lipopolysaccharide transport system permease protein
MALAVSLAFAAASVRWRDLSLALPFVVQAWFFATPIAYPLSVFSGGWKSVLLVLNPMAPIVEGFRWAIIDRGAPHLGSLLISCAIILVGLLGGMVFFNRMERTYADEI